MTQRRPLVLIDGQTSEIPDADQLLAGAAIVTGQLALSRNSTGDSLKVGDDALVGDVDVANGVGIKGQQDAAQGFVAFGSGKHTLGYDGTKLAFDGSTVWHSANFDPSNYASRSGTNYYNPGSVSVFQPTGKVSGQDGDGVAIEVRADGTATGGAFVNFHRPSIYATRFGLNENNEFAFGGWSEGVGNQFRFLTEKNPASFALRSPNVASPALRTIDKVLFQRHDLRDYDGVDYTGANDSAAPVRAAFAASSNDGTLDKLWVPVGQIALASTIDISAGVEVEGNGPIFSRIQPGQTHRGTNFILAHSGVGFHSQGQYRTGEMSNLSTSRLQPDFANAASGTAFTPIDAQWDFLLSSRTTLRRVHLLNATRGISIQFASYGQGHLFEITGEPLLEGLFVQNANDMIFANAINFWPWWSLDSTAERRNQVFKWKYNNATAIRLGRVDAAQWANIFVIGYRNGMVMQNFVHPDSGAAARAQDGHFSGNISNLALDSSVYPFTCSADGVIANLGLGVNGGLLSTADGTDLGLDASVVISGSSNFFSFEQFTGAHSQKGIVVVRGSNNTVKFPDGCHVGYWNESGSTLPAVYKEGSNNSITFGNEATYFGPNPTGVLLGGGIQVPTYTITA